MALKEKKILVVGGTGFIGYHLVNFLKKKKFEVIVLSKRLPSKKKIIKGIKYIQFDISQKKNFQKLYNYQFNYIVNLGGYVDHANKKETFKTHYLGVKNLANYFLKKKIKLFIQMGSGGEYGNLKSPHKENNICRSNFSSNYFYAKYLATKFLMNLSENNNFPATVLRLYQTYGPMQETNRFLPFLITNCLKNKKFKTTHGRQYRDFIYITDLIFIIYKCLINFQDIKNQIINIGFGKPLNIKKIIYKIMKICKGGTPLFGSIELREDENLITFPSIQKLKRLLFIVPKVNFEKGIKITIKSYKKLKVMLPR